MDTAYIYIIYPKNYNKDDIYTRQFYIGSTFNNINKTIEEFYKELYNSSSEKKIMLMRKYMSSYNININEDRIKRPHDKFWQFKTLFIGHEWCNRPLLKSLEGLYIYYYYSILNDEDIKFDPAIITDEEKEFFDEIGILEHLYKCYKEFSFEELNYDVNPYTLIKKEETLKQYIHIYKDICERTHIPIFDDIEHLTYQYIYDPESEPEPEPEPFEYPCYEPGPNGRYKCKWCDKSYLRYNSNLYDHLIIKHPERYNDTKDNFNRARP